MSSLYRRYRPAVFSDLIGQELLSGILRRSIETDRVAHAYIFSGPRGSGKTTVARILAKAINCQERFSAEPCQKCPICLEIAAGGLTDIIEIDAASNRGIDEIRQLRETVVFAPIRSKYKVFIIDEAHMLTKEAFNALLKTLEEPPSHAVFILATTELHKVPETIISRCLRLAFRPATETELISLLTKVITAEKIAIETGALEVIAQRAAGSFRDSLTILATLTAMGTKAGTNDASIVPITADQVRLAIGLPDLVLVEEIYHLLLNGSAKELVTRLREVLDTGGQLAVVLTGLINQAQKELLEIDSGANENLEKVVNLLERLVVTQWRSKQALESAPATIAGLVGICLDNKPAISEIEAVKRSESPAESTLMRDLQPPSVKEIKDTSETVDSLSQVAVDQSDFWSRLLTAVKEKNHALYAVVHSARLAFLSDDRIVVEVKFRFWAERLYEKRNRALIEQIAADLTGRRRSLECQVVPKLPSPVSEDNEELVKTVVEVFELKADG